MWRWKFACDQPPWSCGRPACSSVRFAISCRRPPREAEDVAAARAPTTAMIAPSLRRRSGIERREEQLPAQVDGVVDRPGSVSVRQKLSGPERKSRGVRAVAVELGVEPAADPLDVDARPSRWSCVMPSAGRGPPDPVQQRVDARLGVARGRRQARIELTYRVIAQPWPRGTPPVPQRVPGHHRRHRAPRSSARDARFYCPALRPVWACRRARLALNLTTPSRRGLARRSASEAGSAAAG